MAAPDQVPGQEFEYVHFILVFLLFLMLRFCLLLPLLLLLLEVNCLVCLISGG